MDCNKETRNIDPYNTAQNASTRHSDRKLTQNIFGGKDIRDEEMSDNTQEEDSTNDEYDQDSSISFEDEAKKVN